MTADLITATAAAKLLGVSKGVLLALCRRGLIRGAYTVGAGDVRIWVIPTGDDGRPVRLRGKRGAPPRNQ